MLNPSTIFLIIAIPREIFPFSPEEISLGCHIRLVIKKKSNFCARNKAKALPFLAYEK